MENREPRSPIDPNGEWYDQNLADQVERMHRLEKCSKQYGSCAARFREEGGAICCDGCKPYVVDVEHQVPVPPDIPWQLRVAAAYRWKHDHGETMPVGLDPIGPEVGRAVRQYEDALETELGLQNKARAELKAKIVGDGKNPDGTPTPEAIAFVELCVRQYKANMAGFVERSRKAFEE